MLEEQFYIWVREASDDQLARVRNTIQMVIEMRERKQKEAQIRLWEAYPVPCRQWCQIHGRLLLCEHVPGHLDTELSHQASNNHRCCWHHDHSIGLIARVSCFALCCVIQKYLRWEPNPSQEGGVGIHFVTKKPRMEITFTFR